MSENKPKMTFFWMKIGFQASDIKKLTSFSGINESRSSADVCETLGARSERIFQ